MDSKVKISGHPVHVMVNDFPIAFYTAATIAYIGYFNARQPDVFWFQLGVVANIAGVVMAVVAAIPGMIDLFYGIPTTSAAKSVGMVHGILQVTALAFFAGALAVNYRQFDFVNPDAGWSVLLSIGGLACNYVGAWFGWQLVARQHVGIDLTLEQEAIDSERRAA